MRQSEVVTTFGRSSTASKKGGFMQKKSIMWFMIVIACLSFSLAVAGCTTIKKGNARRTEQLLAAGGFKMQLATTPEQLAHLEEMTQRKITIHSQNGETRYVYADALECKCVYVGDEHAYQQYQKLQVQQNIADENQMSAQMNEDASMDWGMWGPWGPWGPWYY